jgi:hypothetical protein
MARKCAMKPWIAFTPPELLVGYTSVVCVDYAHVLLNFPASSRTPVFREIDSSARRMRSKST